VTIGYYYLAVALAFAATIPIRIRVGLNWNISDFIALPAGACLLIEAARSPLVGDRLRALYRANRVVFWYFAWATIAAVFGLVRSDDSLRTWLYLVPGFVLYALVGLTADRPSRIRAVLVASLAGTSCHLALGLAQGLFGGPYLLKVSNITEAKLGLGGDVLAHAPVGLFAHPNALGVFLLPVTLFLVVLVLARGRYRPILFAILLVDASVLALAQVKGVLAFLALGIALLLVPRPLERWRFALSLTAPVLSIAALVGFAIWRFLDGHSEMGTMVARLELSHQAILVLMTDTFTQVFGNGYPLFAKGKFFSVGYPDAHNAWLNQALGFGLVALVLYLGAFATSLWMLCRKLATGWNADRPLVLAAVTSLAVLLGEQFFEPVDRDVAAVAHLFLLFALAVVLPPATATGPAYEPTRPS
jgi:hypothetical protein